MFLQIKLASLYVPVFMSNVHALSPMADTTLFSTVPKSKNGNIPAQSMRQRQQDTFNRTIYLRDS